MNGDMTFGLDFDSEAKAIKLNLKSLLLGQIDTPKENLGSVQAILNPMINQTLKNDQESKSVLNQANSVRIESNELVIETK